MTNLLEQVQAQTRKNCDPSEPALAPAPAWRQPEVEKLYQQWMTAHFGEVDMELLCSAMFNAGARSAVNAMVAWGDLMPQLGRMESRVIGTIANMRSVLESLTAEDR